MKIAAILTVFIVPCAVTACAEEKAATTPAAATDAAGDTSADTAGDTAAETTGDTWADTLGDGLADAADVAPDIAVPPDAQADAAEVTPDGADGIGDTAVDIASDAVVDTAGDTASDTAVDTAGDTAIQGVSCSGSPVKFPQFAKTCANDADCFVALHQINCCGTLGAFGLAGAEKAAFAAAEAQCQAQYPDCKCAQQPTMGEDGYTTKDTDFKAVCQAGLCRAVVPEPKAECTSAGLIWPKPVKACQTTADCTYAMKTIDCCGTQLATGITKAAKSAFEAAEFKCATAMAICDCMPKPVTHDDGSSAGDGMTAVSCDQGLCSTYAK